MNRSDDQLILSVLSNSLDAFDTLMRRYEKLVFKIAFGFCHNRENALDLVQSVFLKVYEKLPSLNEPAQFRGWLIRIAYNECISSRRGAVEHHSLQELTDQEREPVAFEDPDQGFLAAEQRRQLARMLNLLNPNHRLAVVLRYFEGLPIREIALALECSEGVAKSMIYRGMRRMSGMAES